MDRTALKTEIRAAAAECSATKSIARRCRPEAKPHLAWRDYHAASHHARHLMLAYAFVRGVPYRHVETHTECGPYASAVAERAGVPEEHVAAWLLVPEEPARIAIRESAKAARRARYEAAIAMHAERRRGAA